MFYAASTGHTVQSFCKRFCVRIIDQFYREQNNKKIQKEVGSETTDTTLMYQTVDCW